MLTQIKLITIFFLFGSIFSFNLKKKIAPENHFNPSLAIVLLKFRFKEGTSKKNSYARRDYESVDEKSLS